MTSNHHAPYDLGYTRATMARTKGSDPVKASKSQKRRLSSDCSLQPDYMKLESLVIANQNVAVNTFPGLGMPEVSDPTHISVHDRVTTERSSVVFDKRIRRGGMA